MDSVVVAVAVGSREEASCTAHTDRRVVVVSWAVAEEGMTVAELASVAASFS